MPPTRVSLVVSNPARLPRDAPPCQKLSKNGSFWTRIQPQQTAANAASRMSLARAIGLFLREGWTGTLRKQMTKPNSANTANCGCGARIG